MLDFNASLGSDATWPKPIIAGTTYRIDWASAALHLVAFGLYYPYWLAASSSPYRSVGPFEAETFDPGTLAALVPQPGLPARDRPRCLLGRVDLGLLHARARARGRRFRAVHRARGRRLGRGRAERASREDPALRVPRRPPARPAAGRRVQPAASGRSGARYRDSGLPVRYRARVRWNRPGATDREIGSTTISSAMLDLAAYLHEARTRFDRFDESPFLSVRFTREREGKAVGPGLHVHLRVDGARAFPIGISREVD